MHAIECPPSLESLDRRGTSWVEDAVMKTYRSDWSIEANAAVVKIAPRRVRQAVMELRRLGLMSVSAPASPVCGWSGPTVPPPPPPPPPPTPAVESAAAACARYLSEWREWRRVKGDDA